jgi:hypothetical protein
VHAEHLEQRARVILRGAADPVQIDRPRFLQRRQRVRTRAASSGGRWKRRNSRIASGKDWRKR